MIWMRPTPTLSKKVIKWYKVLSKKCTTEVNIPSRKWKCSILHKRCPFFSAEQTVRRWTPLGRLPAFIVAKFSAMQKLSRDTFDSTTRKVSLIATYVRENPAKNQWSVHWSMSFKSQKILWHSSKLQSQRQKHWNVWRCHSKSYNAFQ